MGIDDLQTVKEFQSPKSGKFESNGKFYSIPEAALVFQSPKSGKFESNLSNNVKTVAKASACFNPLNRGNLNQIA